MRLTLTLIEAGLEIGCNHSAWAATLRIFSSIHNHDRLCILLNVATAQPCLKTQILKVFFLKEVFRFAGNMHLKR